MKRTITVLQDDIDKGERNNANHCAIARAVNRELADLLPESYFIYNDQRVSVNREGIRLLRYVRAGGSDMSFIAYSAITPPEAQQFIMGFDEGEPVEPFKFELELRKR
jgi:hypothetical protein